MESDNSNSNDLSTTKNLIKITICDEQFKVDLDDTLERSRAAGVERIYMPNIDHTTIDSMLEIEHKNPESYIPMMGLHPCSVKKDFEKELCACIMGPPGSSPRLPLFFIEIELREHELDSFPLPGSHQYVQKIRFKRKGGGVTECV